MFTTLDELIMARASKMAEHDGDNVGPLFILGAANLLQAELITARDRLMQKPAGSAHEPGVPDVSAQEQTPDPEPASIPEPEGPAVEEPAPVAEPEAEEESPTDVEPAPSEEAAE